MASSGISAAAGSDGGYKFGGVISDTAVDETPLSEIPQIFADLKKTFLSGKTLDLSFRKQQLIQLHKMLDENADRFVAAVNKHERRNKWEVMSSEISGARGEIAHQINHLEEYAAPTKVPSSAIFLTDRGVMKPVPRGTVMIMGAWNFPITLTLKPLAGAIAAGCTVIIRPSEIVSEVSREFANLIPKYLDPSCYRVVVGGVPVNTELLKLPFNLVFYTGSCFVGKIVATAMAKHLCPVVLELGGKNPVVIDVDSCDLRTAAKRIVWARYALNSGQVCLCPEYILIPRYKQDEFVGYLEEVIQEFFGKTPELQSKSDSYGRIVSNNHFNRLSKLLDNMKDKVAVGGLTKAEERFISPTVLKNVTNTDMIMEDEVFGPILSVCPIDCSKGNKSEFKKKCLDLIQGKPKPLAMYIFSDDRTFTDEIIDKTDSGGVTVNDCLMHYSFKGFPFGGTGYSGMGKYHGKYSFSAFSHNKPVLYKYSGAEFLNDSARNPPFNEGKYNMIKNAAEEKIESGVTKFLPSLGTAAALSGLAYYLQSKL